MQLTRKAQGVPGNLPQLLLQFVQAGCQFGIYVVFNGKTTHIDRKGTKLLCQVVVKFMSNETAFDFLRVKQLSAQFPQMFFCLSLIREVDTAADITKKSPVVSVSRYAIMKNPPINAVVTQQPILQREGLSRFERG